MTGNRPEAAPPGRRAHVALALLATLPPREAGAVAAVTVGGCTFKEAAELLGEPESEVRRHVLRGFQALSRVLQA